MNQFMGLTLPQCEEVVKKMTGKTTVEIGQMFAEMHRLGKEVSKLEALVDREQKEKDQWLKKVKALKEENGKLEKKARAAATS